MAAGQVGAVYPAGARLWSVSSASVGPGAGDVSVTLVDLASAAPPVSVTLSPAFQPCSLLDWPDALELGWGIGAIWIIAAGVLFLLRGSKGSPA